MMPPITGPARSAATEAATTVAAVIVTLTRRVSSVAVRIIVLTGAGRRAGGQSPSTYCTDRPFPGRLRAEPNEARWYVCTTPDRHGRAGRRPRPGHPRLALRQRRGVDGRDKHGHDDAKSRTTAGRQPSSFDRIAACRA